VSKSASAYGTRRNARKKPLSYRTALPFRQDFLQLEKRWLELARSIEFGEQLDSFTKNSPKPNIKPNVSR
jgi:hypothetical protein